MIAEVWFWLLALMLAVYAVLDGLDFGVGILHFFLGKTPTERNTLLASIGPVWDGNEVWLVAAGGTLFAAFPALYACAFSGFYLPLMIVLWLLLFRALGIEIRHQLRDPMWQELWDAAFSGASALLAVFFGAALGNLVRGLPLNAKGEFFEPLWTDFRVGERVGILDWYTLLVAVAAAATLTLHGALWVVFKTDGELCARARQAARRAWVVVVVLSVATSLASFWVQPQLRANLVRYPLGLLLPLLAAAGLVATRVLLAKQARTAFIASSVFVLAQVLSAAFAIFPNALPARIPGRELLLERAAADPETLRTMLYWWIPGMVIAASYSYFAYRGLPKTFRADDPH